jgi:hypothetical protein
MLCFLDHCEKSGIELMSHEMFRGMGAKINLGQALLGLGRLHKAKNRKKDARKCFIEAIHIFQESNALLFLTQAKEDLLGYPLSFFLHTDDYDSGGRLQQQRQR